MPGVVAEFWLLDSESFEVKGDRDCLWDSEMNTGCRDSICSTLSLCLSPGEWPEASRMTSVGLFKMECVRLTWGCCCGG